MTSKIICNKSNPPIGGLAVTLLINNKRTTPIEIEWANETSLLRNNSSKFICHTNNDVLRSLARDDAPQHLKLYGETPLERTQIDHWLTFSLSINKDIQSSVGFLNKSLGPITYLVSNQYTIADFAVFHEIYLNKAEVFKSNPSNHVQRWYHLISSQSFVVDMIKILPPILMAEKVVKTSNKNNLKENSVERKQEGKFVDLPGAEMGKVIVRFPPEASGYLHIGHAKAALLNQYYQQAFQGKLIMRFDDTNPAKENVDFEKVILEDLEMLEIKSDIFTYTSDYFDLMLEYCEKLMKDNLAYVDDTPPEQMKIEREQKTESINRSNSVEKNFELWKEMLNGSERGKKCCVRARIDMSSPNGCLRDPTIYRCKPEPHPRTGTKYKVYPTYDFACPIVDAIENVTHTLRTMEYHDRDDQFYWFIDALKLRKPYIWEYARLNMTNTVLSKRKLTWFVENQLVDGWDDPRFPTVRGILRRGMTVEGLKQFIIAQGSSKSVVFMEWDKIWAINKKVIDPVAPRYTALENSNTIVVNVKGAEKGELQHPLHPKNTDVGMKTVHIGSRILIDYVDAETLVEGENTTFINWGNIMINKINKDNNKIQTIDATLNIDNKDFKKTKKLTWLCEMEYEEYTPTYCVYFEHIICKGVLGKDEDFKNFIGKDTRTEVSMLGDPELKKLKKGDIIQLQRRGYFKVDNAYAVRSELTGIQSPIVLFSIPDGHTKEMPTAGPPKKNTEKVQTQKSAKPDGDSSVINDKISKQSEIVRNLKAQKVSKQEIDDAVKVLLALKVEYKNVTGNDWKPPTTALLANPVTTTSLASTHTSNDLNVKITKQGEVVRNLKAQKISKPEIEAAVKVLLALKGEYKNATGNDWKPVTTAILANPVTTTSLASGDALNDLNDQITKQGEVVRNLKAQKISKQEIEAAVKVLLALKGEYKNATGNDWKPVTTAILANPVTTTSLASGDALNDLNDQITKQGEVVRNLKAQKISKQEIEAAVKVLLALKGEYKNATGNDWKPVKTAILANPVITSSLSSGDALNDLNDQITKQGEVVRNLKAQKTSKQEIEAAVKVLLALKDEYKNATGNDWNPVTTAILTNPVITFSLSSGDASNYLNDKITKQVEIVRILKAQKVSKQVIESAAKVLSALKVEYKKATGNDWNPVTTAILANPVITSSLSSGDDSNDLNDKITKQGEAIRNLKAQKTSKQEIDDAVKVLLALKVEYKKTTGNDWKPPVPVEADPVIIPVAQAPTVAREDIKKELNEKILKLGEILRELKSRRVTKLVLNAAVGDLFALKAQYKAAVGESWKPPVIIIAIPPVLNGVTPEVAEEITQLHTEIAKQGAIIRNLKAEKAPEEDIENEVKTILELKGNYKTLVGVNWSANALLPNKIQPRPSLDKMRRNPADDLKITNEILTNIKIEGDKLRKLKSEKVEKSIIDASVKILINLKKEYRSFTGQDWRSGTVPKSKMNPASLEYTEQDQLENEINSKGNIINVLKMNEEPQEEIDIYVKSLLLLKAKYKELYGTDFPRRGRGSRGPKKPKSENALQKNEQKQQQEPNSSSMEKQIESKDDSTSSKKQSRLGLEAKKEENLSDWYSQVITKGELIEYYDVSGCYILRHWSFAVWKIIKTWFDNEITKMGVKECYFPIFVSKAALEKEKDHIADFAPEVAWVTKSGDSELAEPIAVRPTSETVMYPAYAKWIQSYRDLPIRLNQWNNVVRWEFKHPQPFLRTREFLWQEGHTAFASKKEAEDEVLDILDLYAKVYTDLLAIPVVKGRKTEKEKFAGGDYTTTVEAYISASGRAIQGATSHHLGQNFSKMFEIVFEDPETKIKQYVYQNSWGITTRTIGVMVMIHADNQGLVLPPQVASIQCIIVPCGLTVHTKDNDRTELIKKCQHLEKELKNKNIRAESDYRDNYSPGWKFNHWEVKGVPIRIELGPKDLKAKQFVAVRRDTGEKIKIPRANAIKSIEDLLKTIHQSMLDKATKDLMEHIKPTTNWTDFCKLLDEKNLILSPFCGEMSCEEKIKAESARDDSENMEAGAPSMGAKSLCIPFDQPNPINEIDKCIHSVCQNKPKFYTLFGRSY